MPERAPASSVLAGGVAAGGSSRPGREVVRDGEMVVGWVAGVPVTVASLEDYLSDLANTRVGACLALVPGQARPEVLGEPGGDPHRVGALRAWATKALLLDRLVVADAARLGVRDLRSPDEWMDRLVAAGEISFPPPTAEEAVACYKVNRYRYRTGEARRARHVLVADRGAAEEVLATVRGGTVLAKLAAELSLDIGSRAQGGDLGWVRPGQLSGPLEDAIFAAVPGRAYGPVNSAFGWHVLVVEEVRPAQERPFTECRDEITAELAADRRRAAWRGWWERRVAEAINVPLGTEHPLSPGLPGSGHRH